MKIFRLSLIKKIAIFQIVTLVIAVAIYWYFYDKYQHESERRLLSLRESEVVTFIMPYYDEIVSSYILGIQDYYQQLRNKLIDEKELVDLNIVEDASHNAQGVNPFVYNISPNNSDIPYSIAIDDSDMASKLIRMKRNDRMQNMAIWCAIFILLMGSSIFIYDNEISRPIRRLLNAIRKESPQKDLAQVANKDGGEIGGIAHEISDMITRIQRMERIERDLARERDMNLMHSKLAHDMRSPLSVLKSYVGMGKAKANEEAEYKAAADRSVKKLLHMADDLIDYAKASKVERGAVSLEKCIRDSISEAASAAASKGVAIENEIDEGFVVNIDSYRIGRMLVNLVNNAAQAIIHDHGRVLVRANIEDGNSLVVKVKDNGRGIDSEHLPHVFENFFTKGKKRGTGLGLSYCKQVVEAHGGTIDVESEVGKGTTFTIRIPDCVVTEAETRTCKNDLKINIDGRKFILVDDDADIRLRWRRIVEAGGGQVVAEADSPEKATGDGLDVAAADVAIVDYSFDGTQMTGVDVVTHLKRQGLKEVHMCTGYAGDEAVRRAAIAAGADSVIQKNLG